MGQRIRLHIGIIEVDWKQLAFNLWNQLREATAEIDKAQGYVDKLDECWKDEAQDRVATQAAATAVTVKLRRLIEPGLCVICEEPINFGNSPVQDLLSSDIFCEGCKVGIATHATELWPEVAAEHDAKVKSLP